MQVVRFDFWSSLFASMPGTGVMLGRVGSEALDQLAPITGSASLTISRLGHPLQAAALALPWVWAVWARTSINERHFQGLLLSLYTHAC